MDANGVGGKRIDGKLIGLIALITLLGFGLRIWGIGWSLPNARHPLATYHPDERVDLAATLAVDIPHLQFDTQFYNYGTFYFYLASFAQTIGRGYGMIPSTLPPPADTPLSDVARMERAAPELASLFLAGRLVTVLLGTATIPLLFLLGSSLFDRRAGYLAAFLYAIAPFAVVHAHFLTVDVPATFFVTLALFASAWLLKEQSWRSYVLAGVACGLCAATKYNTTLVLVVPLVAHGLNRIPNSCQIHRWAHLLVMLAVTVVTFLVACPGPIINWEAFWNGTYPGSGVRYELFEHSRMGHGVQFQDTGLGWIYHLSVSLPYGLGYPLLLMAIAGIVIACRQRTRGDLLLLSFVILYFGATGLSAVRFARYMLPLFPALCLLTARLLTDRSRRFASSDAPADQESSFDASNQASIEVTTEVTTEASTKASTKASAANSVPILHTLIATGVVAFTLAYTVGLVARMGQTDPRDLAADYLDTHARQGATVAFATTPWYYAPPLSPRFGEVAAPMRAKAVEVTRYRLLLPTRGTEWDKSVLSPLPDFIVLSNIETIHTVDRLRQPEAVSWVATIPQTYRVKTFGDSSVFGMPVHTSIIPEDLLYIIPQIKIYSSQ